MAPPAHGERFRRPARRPKCVAPPGERPQGAAGSGETATAEPERGDRVFFGILPDAGTPPRRTFGPPPDSLEGRVVRERMPGETAAGAG